MDSVLKMCFVCKTEQACIYIYKHLTYEPTGKKIQIQIYMNNKKNWKVQGRRMNINWDNIQIVILRDSGNYLLIFNPVQHDECYLGIYCTMINDRCKIKSII